MKLRLVVAALVCVLLVTGASAQQSMAGLSPRAAAMGGAGIGVADDAAAWYQNPAGLAALNVPCQEGAAFGTQALFAYANTNDENSYEISVSGWNPSQHFGYGAGYVNGSILGGLAGPQLATATREGYYESAISRIAGVGFGAAFNNMPLSAGLNVLNVAGRRYEDMYEEQLGFGGFDLTILNAGLMYRISQGAGKAPIRLGLTATDLTDRSNMGPFYNAGIAWNPANNLLIAIDATDLSDQMDNGVLVSGGVEYCLKDAGRQYFGRAGLMDVGDDHDFTVGVGYQANIWHLDFAWVNSQPQDTWTVGVSRDM